MPLQLTPDKPPYYETGTSGLTIYQAIIKQSGTSTPTAIELKNTFGTITWTRLNIGEYQGAYTANTEIPNKSIVLATLSADFAAPKIVRANAESNRLYIITEDAAGSQTDINSGTEPGLYITLTTY